MPLKIILRKNIHYQAHSCLLEMGRANARTLTQPLSVRFWPDEDMLRKIRSEWV